jgi:hypothetical protein
MTGRAGMYEITSPFETRRGVAFPPHTAHMRTLAALLIAALMATLAACGGGGDDGDDDSKTTPPVDCHERPEVCK